MPPRQPPFEALKPPPPNERPPPMVRVGMLKTRRPRARKRAGARMQILVRERVLDRLGSNLPHRYAIELGRDHGVRHELVIRRDPKGAFEAIRLSSPGKHPSDVFRILLDRHERFPPYRVPLQEVDFRHDETGARMVVILPSWAFDATERERLDHRAAVAGARGTELRA